jgi:hypothetical protein
MTMRTEDVTVTAVSFTSFQVRSVVNDTRQNIDFASLDLHVILQEFSSIS